MKLTFMKIVRLLYYLPMERMKVKDSDWINEIYLKVTIQDLEEENKKLKERVEELEGERSRDGLLWQATMEEAYNRITELEKENKKLKKYYDRDKEELMESCYSLAKENDKLKSDLEECECSFWFENDEVWFWKLEYKRLKKWIKDHCNGYWNLFPEDEMKRQWKKADKKRKLKSTYVYDAKQVRDIC